LLVLRRATSGQGLQTALRLSPCVSDKGKSADELTDRVNEETLRGSRYENS
jgi:hypothetical protein